MSEQQSQMTATAVQERPVPQGYLSWPDYWTAQGMPWRTQPEIDAERQRYLAERRAIQPDTEKGVFAFRDETGGIKLDRADVEWLLATHQSRGKVGPIWWTEEKDKPADERREGLDVRGADLRQANLSALPLACMRGGLALAELPVAFIERPDLELPQLYEYTEGAAAAAVHLDAADLHDAHLEHAQLGRAHLAGAQLGRAHLEGAQLLQADLENAGLSLTHLEGAFLFAADLRGIPYAFAIGAHLEHADLRYAYLEGRVLVEAHLTDADLRGAAFSDSSALNGAWLGSQTDGVARLADIKARGTNLAQVRWVRPRRGHRAASKSEAHELGSSLVQVERTLRASRQLALALRGQGLSGEADRFAYQAQGLQRRVHRLQRRPLRYFGSLLLDLMSGYGYKPMRSFLAYVLVILAFAGLYLLNAQFAMPHLSWDESLVLSVSSFHGRGFFSSDIHLGDTLARLAAGEAILGLLIEITFIATFTQRFFAR
jgi:uncharacterized protein YjbI with pentapeptide repeats